MKKFIVYERYYTANKKRNSYIGITSQKFRERKAQHRYRIGLALKQIKNGNNKYDKQSLVIARHMKANGITVEDLKFKIIYKDMTPFQAKMLELLMINKSTMFVNKQNKSWKEDKNE